MALPFILPQIQRHDWPEKAENSTQSLHPQLEPGPGDQTVPLVSWSFSIGPMAAFVGPDWLTRNGVTAEEVHAQALSNLATRGAAVGMMDIPTPTGKAVKLAIIEGDRGDNPDHIAAADHLLNRSALEMLHEGLGVEQYVMAAPCRQVLYAGDVSLAMDGPFIHFANKLPFEGAERLTSVVFLVRDAQIIGKLNYR